MAGSVKDWQSEKTFKETNLRMLENQLLTDVTFHVGESGETVQAHKFILVSRSCVFETMFCGPLPENNTVIIPDIEVDVFKVFLRFLYGSSIHLNEINVLPLLYVAKKYSVIALEKNCLNYCESNLSPKNACTIFQQAYMYDNENLKSKSLAVIKMNSKACVESEGFLELNPHCLSVILNTDGLMTGETDIFKGTLKWADAECRRQKREVTAAEIRNVLGEMIFLIRFSTMSQSELSKCVYPTKILTDEELLHFFVRLTLPETPVGKFVTRPRAPSIFHLTRSIFRCHENLDENRQDAIYMLCSHPVILTSIYVFGGDIDTEFVMSCNIEIKSTNNFYQATIDVNRSRCDIHCQLKLTNPLPLETKEEVLLKVRGKGPKRFLCKMNSKSTMCETDSGVTWRFRMSTASTSVNSLDYGIITGFDYSVVK